MAGLATLLIFEMQFSTAAPFPYRPSFQQIMDYIRSERSIRSSEAFLAALPESYRAQYSLALKSMTIARERRLVSTSNPRLIIHAQADYASAQIEQPFMFGFIQGSNSVEVIEFDLNRFIFVPHLIEFGSFPRGVRFDHGLETCLPCHTANLEESMHDPAAFRPNWNPYSTWAGFLGQTHFRPSDREVQILRSLQNSPQGFLKYLPGFESVDIDDLSPMHLNFGKTLSLMNALRIGGILGGEFQAFSDSMQQAAQLYEQSLTEVFEDRLRAYKGEIEKFERTQQRYGRILDPEIPIESSIARQAADVVLFEEMVKQKAPSRLKLLYDDLPMIPVNIYGQPFHSFSDGVEGMLKMLFPISQPKTGSVTCPVARQNVHARILQNTVRSSRE